MKSKFISLIICLLFSINVDAYDFARDGIFYTVISQEEATCEVASKYDNDYPESTYSGYVNIPETVCDDFSQAEYTVVGVGKWAFYNSQLEGITLPSTITRIEESAFQSCKGISSFVIPKNIEYIGDDAFYSSDLAVSLFIPKCCRHIGSSAFAYTNITELTIEPEYIIPSSPRVINECAFSYCKYLSYVNLNQLHDDFGRNPFMGCSNLNAIEGDGLYTDFPNKGNLIIDGCLYKFDEYDNIRNLELICCPGGMNSYTSPNSHTGTENKKYVLTTLGNSAFGGCSKITFLDIPNTVKTIKDYALFMPVGETKPDFDYIYRKVNIPESVEELGRDVFGWWGINWDIYLYSTHIKNIHSTFGPGDDGSKFGKIHIPHGTLSSFGTEGTRKTFDIIDDIGIKYKLIYLLDNEVYKEIELWEGESITPEPELTKDGYTFSGWSEIPETMPAHDVTISGTFTVNKYKLIYKVDDIEYKSYDVEFGATITPETEPTKEGYTFSGWSWIPTKMPAEDVTVTGAFTINKYKLIYKVNGAEYKTYEVEFGATITPETEPTKEGYTFLGWSWIPSKMPAEDVIVTGSLTVNKYKLIYKVDGAEYKTYEVEFGAAITPEPEPTKEGYTFSGWSWIPSKMPAEDVTITGTFTINKYKLTYKVDGEVYKSYDVEYGATITPEAVPTKEGYTFSGWSEIPETMPAHDVTVTGIFKQETGIDQIMLNENGSTMIFTIDGKTLDKPQKGLNIVKMSDGKTRKVVVK